MKIMGIERKFKKDDSFILSDKSKEYIAGILGPKCNFLFYEGYINNCEIVDSKKDYYK